MNKIDKAVMLVVVVLLGCVLVKTALEAAAALIIPVVVVGVGYGGFRAWQSGLLSRFMPHKAVEKKEVQ